MRVLIIEDEFLIARSLAQMLTDGGHVVTGMVGSAEKAIQMLEEQNCDVAVVDANLAGSCAAPIGTALRKRGIPFVVISGYAKQQRSWPACKTHLFYPSLSTLLNCLPLFRRWDLSAEFVRTYSLRTAVDRSDAGAAAPQGAAVLFRLRKLGSCSWRNELRTG